LAGIRADAVAHHMRLGEIAQAVIDGVVAEIRSGRLAGAGLRDRVGQDARAGPGPFPVCGPRYDPLVECLRHPLRVEYEPSETLERTSEMVYLQPTPGRILLEMIDKVPLMSADTFYDLGSGLGHVPILVSLLTDARAVGVEVEPTYVHYARCSAEK